MTQTPTPGTNTIHLSSPSWSTAVLVETDLCLTLLSHKTHVSDTKLTWVDPRLGCAVMYWNINAAAASSSGLDVSGVCCVVSNRPDDVHRLVGV